MSSLIKTMLYLSRNATHLFMLRSSHSNAISLREHYYQSPRARNGVNIVLGLSRLLIEPVQPRTISSFGHLANLVSFARGISCTSLPKTSFTIASLSAIQHPANNRYKKASRQRLRVAYFSGSCLLPFLYTFSCTIIVQLVSTVRHLSRVYECPRQPLRHIFIHINYARIMREIGCAARERNISCVACISWLDDGRILKL